MKLLIIGDIHLEFEKAEKICEYFKEYKIIFVGDYFDQFYDTPELNIACAEWLKSSIKKPNRIHLKGNHDEQYDPRINCYCSGFTSLKKKAINTVLTVEDWDNLKYFHYENNWWISHAGITDYWYGKTYLPYTVDNVQKVIDDSIVKQQMGDYDNAIWGVDYMRGGKHSFGGILWCDWSKLKHIKDMNQIVGHTPKVKILYKENQKLNSKHINVDCTIEEKLCEVLLVDEDGTTSVLSTKNI